MKQTNIYKINEISRLLFENNINSMIIISDSNITFETNNLKIFLSMDYAIYKYSIKINDKIEFFDSYTRFDSLIKDLKIMIQKLKDN